MAQPRVRKLTFTIMTALCKKGIILVGNLKQTDSNWFFPPQLRFSTSVTLAIFCTYAHTYKHIFFHLEKVVLARQCKKARWVRGPLQTSSSKCIHQFNMRLSCLYIHPDNLAKTICLPWMCFANCTQATWAAGKFKPSGVSNI